MLTVTLYSRPGCCLCEEMAAVVRQVQNEMQNETPFQIEEVDISTDPELNIRFSLEIPLLYINGQRAFMYELSAQELRQRLVQESKGV